MDNGLYPTHQSLNRTNKRHRTSEKPREKRTTLGTCRGEDGPEHPGTRHNIRVPAGTGRGGTGLIPVTVLDVRDFHVLRRYTHSRDP